MTLSPVFRSPDAVRLLEEEGVWARLAPAMQAQARAVNALYGDLETLMDSRFLNEDRRVPEEGEMTSPQGLSFLQEYFFLILFRSLFEALGVGKERLTFYTELNFCIKGTITAADNIFDDQAKSLLPLVEQSGARFLSILQLMTFERLIRRTCDRAVSGGLIRPEDTHAILRGLLNRMAEIGELEGSEEGGVEQIPTPEEMIRRVHQVRGGALFALAFVGPSILETGSVGDAVREAEPAIARLGTAFQIVDDLTDFEFDIGRKSHNLLVAEIHHHGNENERAALERLWAGEPVSPDMVEGLFRSSARAVLERAYREAQASLDRLAELGFWFPRELAPQVVQAIVGLDGVTRMEAIATE
ncbi:MAG: class 1 isoprenoid biosynthesis enzyme [Longimicrobiales bacterium]